MVSDNETLNHLSSIIFKLKELKDKEDLHDIYKMEEFNIIQSTFTDEEKSTIYYAVLDSKKFRNEIIEYFEKIQRDKVYRIDHNKK